MATNKRINVADLDFDGIRANLKEFLRGQDRFSDFDFDGSNISILLDILAYNTHYNALYSNLAINELFIDTASKRSSVVSLARSLGYTPKSASSARGTLSFTIVNVPGNPAVISVPRNTRFYAEIDGTRYTFNTVEETTATRNALNEYVFTDVDIIEGIFSTVRYVVENNSRFVIPNANVDTDSLIVRVQDSGQYSNFSYFVDSKTVSNIDGTTKVYFLNETFDGLLEMKFGDGVFGAPLSQGNVIEIEYYITSGAAANGIKRGFLSAEGTVSNGRPVNITLTSLNNGGTFGGADKEDIEEIRNNAPRYYAAQNRAVTANDYEAIIVERVPNVDQCYAWGGETNDPPVYGKVFICAKTVNEQPLSFAEKDNIIQNVLGPVKVLSIATEFVDPEYLLVEVDAVVYFDGNKTNLSTGDISAAAKDVVVQYSENDLEKFNRVFRKSQLSRLIELTNDAIVSTTIRTNMSFFVQPIFGVFTNYTINTNNPVLPGTMKSSVFFLSTVVDTDGINRQLFLEDDSSGNILAYYQLNGSKTYLPGSVGTVDYSKGKVTLTNLNFYSTGSETLKITMTPSTDFVVGTNNKVVSVNKEDIRVSSVRETSNSSVVFTASRV